MEFPANFKSMSHSAKSWPFLTPYPSALGKNVPFKSLKEFLHSFYMRWTDVSTNFRSTDGSENKTDDAFNAYHYPEEFGLHCTADSSVCRMSSGLN